MQQRTVVVGLASALGLAALAGALTVDVEYTGKQVGSCDYPPKPAG